MPVRRVARQVHHTYHLKRGLRLGGLPRATRPDVPLGVLGLFASVLGLGQGARMFLEGCQLAGIGSSPIDVSGYFSLDSTLASPPASAVPPRTVVAHLNPVELQYLIGRMGREFPLGGYRIGFWAWETTEIPADWLPAAGIVDEIWCPSQFTADALRAGFGPDKPIQVLPYPVFAPARLNADKARFGLDPARTTLLCALDLKSSITRKNPMGAIEAFARSGVGASGEAELLVKVHGAQAGDAQLAGLKSGLSRVPGVIFMEDRLQPEDMALLVASVDIVLSAHRSEGFGLVLAEAMAAGKTVIATGWSGNVDFMDDTNSALVRSRRVPVNDPDGIYQGGEWAEPDVDHMAALIRQLVQDPQLRARLGAAASSSVLASCGFETWSARVAAMLGLPRPGTPDGSGPLRLPG